MALSSSTLSSISQFSGNPAFDAASKLSGFMGGSGSSQLDRLDLSRPRSTSNDVTNRGQHAFLKLMTRKGQTPSSESQASVVSDSMDMLTSGATGSGYDKFLLSNLSFEISEKVQVTEVFGDSSVTYFFGRAPVTVRVTGVLIDSPDNSWLTDWIYAYALLLRGSKTAKNYQQVRLVLPSMTVVGSIISTSIDQQSTSDVAIGFNFTLLMSYFMATPPIQIAEGITNAANSINFSTASSFLSQSGINSLSSTASSMLNVIKNPASSIGQIGSAMGKISGGLQGFSSLQGTSSAASSFLDSVTSSIKDGLGSLGSAFSPITTALSSIRASLFAPIYGVMNSLSKLVGAVFGAMGIFNLLMSLTAPIRNILGDIGLIATQALALANIVSNGISQIGRGFQTGFGAVNLYNSALQTLHLTFGCISAIPLNIGNNTATLTRSGLISANAAFLQYNPKKSLSRSASFSKAGGSGSSSSASLSLHGASWSPQKAILAGGIVTSSSGAYL